MNLTIKEIGDLAEWAGFKIDKGKLPDEYDMDTEITIEYFGENLQPIAYFTEYPDEGVYPLG